MIYDIHTGKAIDAPVQRGPVVVDALHAYGDISYIVISAVGYPDDEQSVAEAKRLFELYKAAPKMLEVLQELDQCAAYWSEYDVPIGIHDRIKYAIAKAKGETP